MRFWPRARTRRTWITCGFCIWRRVMERNACAVLLALLAAAIVPTYEAVRAQVRGERTPEGAPYTDITAPDLAIYDRLLNADTAEVCV